MAGVGTAKHQVEAAAFADVCASFHHYYRGAHAQPSLPMLASTQERSVWHGISRHN
jgi:hypothetical protein